MRNTMACIWRAVLCPKIWTLGILAIIGLVSPQTPAWAAIPDVPAGGAYIEAEDYVNMGAPSPYAWNVQSSVTGYQGSGYLYTTTGGTSTVPNGSRVDYPVNFLEAGTYQIWLRARDQAGTGGGDSTFWGMDGAALGALTQNGDNRWEWTTRLQNGTNRVTISAPGVHNLHLWPRETGQHTDAFFIIRTDQSLPAGIAEGSTAGRPAGYTALDFSSTGPTAGYISIADGQKVSGSTIDIVSSKSDGNDLAYTTDLSGLSYRALLRQSDGFNGFSVGGKWAKTDVGGDTTPSPTINGGTLNLIGSGADIGGSRDTFSYLYQAGLTGNFTIDVRVNSVQNTNAWAKAGIMIRQSLANNSRHAMVALTPSNGVSFLRRTSAGGTTSVNTTAGQTAPKWLRIQRNGNTISAYFSNDAVTWTQVGGNQAVDMADPVLVGLAVTSRDAARDCTANFDNFMLTNTLMNNSGGWTSVATPFNAAAAGWNDGERALALYTGGTFAVNTFTYSTCVDATPSSINIPASQEVSGSAVSLHGLFSSTGNVGNFTYQINGAAVGTPWSSNAFGRVTPETVTLTVRGIDPDCGSSTILASRTLTVDNTCQDSTPSSINIPSGQSTGGFTVNLRDFFTKTGDVGDFSYLINGTPVPATWDSTALVPVNTQGFVTLTVLGIDPNNDCPHKPDIVVEAANEIYVDNRCTSVNPTVLFDDSPKYVAAGKQVGYTVTVVNNDGLICDPMDVTLSLVGDSNPADFNPSSLTGGTQSIPARGSKTWNLIIGAKDGVPEWRENFTTVRATIANDPNGHDHAPVDATTKTVVFLVSPITHNSVTTKSTKWGGKWGTSEAGSKYGNFDCLTCHEKNAPNIKWMRDAISTPDGSNWGTTGSDTVAVVFQDARDGSPDWGNDDPLGLDAAEFDNNGGPGRTTSTRSCEVCHSATRYHRHNTAGQADLTHFNDRECTDCHRHSEGFTADCTNCHGNPPIDDSHGGPWGLADVPGATGSTTAGTHYKHVVVLKFPCTYCHANYRQPNQMPLLLNGRYDINHTFDVFGTHEPAATAGHYTGQDGVSYEGVVVAPGQGTLSCENIYCHGGTDNMGGTNPQWNGNIACDSCHGTNAVNTPPGYSHTTHVGKMGIACSICHGVDPAPGNTTQDNPGLIGHDGHTVKGHVNGSVRVDLSGLKQAPYNNSNPTYRGQTVWDSGALAPSVSYGTCSNVACHFNKETPPWNEGPATCTTCHNNGSNNGLLTSAAPNSGQHEAHMNPSRPLAPYFVNKCESCHGGGANTGDHLGHLNFATDFAGDFTYTAPNCTISCHGPTALNNWTAGTPLNCVACHESPYLGPTVVDTDGIGGSANGMAATGYGSHLKALKTENLASLNLAAWDAQCRKCHPYHSGGVTVPLPPASWDNPGTAAVESYNMQERLGIQYTVTGGIHLGGSATSGTSEAQICWNCHDLAANGVSEWGTNSSANTGNISYNYGSLTTSNWTTAVWTSGWAGFAYKTGAIQSTHAVGMAAGYEGVQGKDAVGNIRCSYCHDLHDMNRAVIGTDANGEPLTESFTGKPYLRGSWRGNPYKEDGAPQQYTNYPNTNVYGGVPRGSNSTSQPMGGYWIDQNSNNPTSTWTAEQFGGLCEMCHGNGDGTFSSAEISSLNYFGNQGVGWVSGYNGHANSVKGGAGIGATAAERTARNIFNARSGATSGYAGRQHYAGNSKPGDSGAGLRGDEDSFNKYPKIRSWNNEPENTPNTDAWAVDESGSTTEANYHKFSCSKCHNPHASRLPALMITNCLDTKHNTWDNGGARDPITNVIMTEAQMQIGANSSSTSESRVGGGSGTIPAVLRGTTVSNWTTAQNCHRLGGDDPYHPDDAPGPGAGWNTVTPWTP